MGNTPATQYSKSEINTTQEILDKIKKAQRQVEKNSSSIYRARKRAKTAIVSSKTAIVTGINKLSITPEDSVNTSISISRPITPKDRSGSLVPSVFINDSESEPQLSNHKKSISEISRRRKNSVYITSENIKYMSRKYAVSSYEPTQLYHNDIRLLTFPKHSLFLIIVAENLPQDLNYDLVLSISSGECGYVHRSLTRPVDAVRRPFEEKQYYLGNLTEFEIKKLMGDSSEAFGSINNSYYKGLYLVMTDVNDQLVLYYVFEGKINTILIKQQYPDVLNLETNSAARLISVGDSILCNYWLDPNSKFTNLDDLIKFYTNLGMLSKPCLAVRKNVNVGDMGIYEIKESHIHDRVKVDGGNFGDVYKATWVRNNKGNSGIGSGQKTEVPVALKVLKWDFKNGSLTEASIIEKRKSLNREINVNRRLEHPNIVKLHGVIWNTDVPTMVMDWVNSGSLMHFYTRCQDSERLNYLNKLNNIADFIKQICQGMVYMEKNNIAHRDLRTANVMINVKTPHLSSKIQSVHCQVGDFGLSVMSDFQLSENQEKTKLPIKWVAPEILLRTQQDSLSQLTKSMKPDVWSFGILVYELLTFCQMPYNNMTNQDVKNLLREGKTLIDLEESHWNLYKIFNDKVCDREQMFQEFAFLREFLGYCWSFTAESRPSFAELMGKIEEERLSGIGRTRRIGLDKYS